MKRALPLLLEIRNSGLELGEIRTAMRSALARRPAVRAGLGLVARDAALLAGAERDQLQGVAGRPPVLLGRLASAISAAKPKTMKPRELPMSAIIEASICLEITTVKTW